jgi:hypothetical protein
VAAIVSGAEAVGAVIEARVQQGLDDLDDGALHDPVLDALQQQGPEAAVALGNLHLAVRARMVLTRLDCPPKGATEVPDLVTFEVLVREACRSWCCASVSLEILPRDLEVALVGYPAQQSRADRTDRPAPLVGSHGGGSLVSAQEVHAAALMGLDGNLAGTSASALLNVSALAETKVHAASS